MIISKLFGLYIAVIVYQLDIFLENNISGIFSFQIYIEDLSNTILANSVSNLFMITIFFLVSIYLTVKHLLYHKTKDNPRTIVKLTRLNLLKWVTSKDCKFLKIFMWDSFLIASCAISISSAYNGTSYNWVGFVGFSYVVVTFWTLIRTFEVETAKIYPRKNNNLY